MTVRALAQSRTESHGSNNRQTACARTLDGNEHLLEVEKSFQNQKVHARVGEQPDLFGNQVSDVPPRGRAFPFGKLCARNRASDQGFIPRNVARYAHRGVVDRFRLLAVTGPVQFFPSSKESERLQDFGTGVKELAMQFAQCIGMFDGYFGRKLPAALARTDLFASRTTGHPAPALEFKQVSAVAQHHTLRRDSFQYVFSLLPKHNLPCLAGT